MEKLPIFAFKSSFGPILKLLNDNNIDYEMGQTRSGVGMASSGVLEVILSPNVWWALEIIVVTFIKAKHGRNIIITTKDDKIIHADGLTNEELDIMLREAKNLTAIDSDSI